MTAPAEHQSDTPGQDWMVLLHELIEQISQWAGAKEWSVHQGQKTIHERLLGTYVAPTLRIRTSQGEIHVDPVARAVMGADGRVDIEAWPSLNRVRLVRSADQWQVITDSNIPLRRPWNRETFIDLANNLAAAP